MAVRVCEICGNRFDGATSSSVCDNCKTQICPVCGNEFKLTYYTRGQFKKHGYACCGRSCSMKMSHERGDFKPKEAVTRVCRVCGEEFESDAVNAWYCPNCKVKPCVVCGKPVELASWRMSKFLSDGFITCGSVVCANEVRRRTCQDKEGVDSPAQFAESRRKQRERYEALSDEDKQRRVMQMVSRSRTPEANAKRVDTMLLKHGVEYGVQTKVCQERSHSKEARANAKQTMLENTGYGSNLERPEVKAKAHSSEAIEKTKSQIRERTGFDYMIDVPWVREKANGPEANEKRVQTNMQKYGRPYHLCNDTEQRMCEYHAKHPEATLGEVSNALEISYSAACLQNLAKNIGIPTKRSYFEDLIAEFLDEMGVTYKRRYHGLDLQNSGSKRREVDFYIEGANVAIEVNDFLTHSVNYSPYGKQKPKQYHWDKVKMCRESGVRLIHAWEHCLPTANVKSKRIGSWGVLRDVIGHALGISPNRIYARNTNVVEFPAIQLKGFFDANNINGYRNAKVAYCLVPKDVGNPTPDDVVMAYAVGRAHFGKGKYDAEIARGACRLGWTVVGGASKLWHYIIENTDYGSIVYYVDRNYYNADSMGFLDGVEYVGHSDSFWNYFPETGELKNREPARHAEIKAGYEDGSIWQIYNAGTDTYVWHRQ